MTISSREVSNVTETSVLRLDVAVVRDSAGAEVGAENEFSGAAIAEVVTDVQGLEIHFCLRDIRMTVGARRNSVEIE